MLKGKLGNPRAIFGRRNITPAVPGTAHSGAATVPGPEFVPSGIDLPGLDIGDPESFAVSSGSVGDLTRSLQVLLETSECKYSGDGLKGILLYSNREYEAAIHEFDREIAEYPDVICISLLKVRALMHLNRFTEAFELNRRIMKNAPNNYEAVALGAVLADHLGQTDFALRACAMATAIRHNSPLMWALKGALFRKTGKYPEALAALQQSIELDGDSDLTWKEFGDVLSRTGKYPEAIHAFEKVLILAGDDPKIRARIETCRKKLNSPGTMESPLPQNLETTQNPDPSRGPTAEQDDPRRMRFPDTGMFASYDHHSLVDRPDPAGNETPEVRKG